jgi:phage terminase large subunit
MKSNKYYYSCYGFSPLNPSGILFKGSADIEEIFDFGKQYPDYEIDVRVYDGKKVEYCKDSWSVNITDKPEFKFTLNYKEEK